MTDTLRLTDIAVIPVRPCAFDVYTMRLVDDLVIEAREQNPGLSALALINQASTNHLSQEAGQIRDVILAGCGGLHVAESVVGYRVAFQRASSVGRAISEFARPTDRGVREMVDVYQEVFGSVSVRPRHLVFKPPSGVH